MQAKGVKYDSKRSIGWGNHLVNQIRGHSDQPWVDLLSADQNIQNKRYAMRRNKKMDESDEIAQKIFHVWGIGEGSFDVSFNGDKRHKKEWDLQCHSA